MIWRFKMERSMLDNKTILVTGGTGSFGHSFTQYVLEHYNPKKLSGIGGFINITQFTPRVVFCTTFTAGGLEIAQDEELVNSIKKAFKEQGAVAQLRKPILKGHKKEIIAILKKYDNSDGDHYELTDLRIDEPVEKKTFDPTGYSGKDVFGKPVH